MDVWGAMLESYHKLQPKPKIIPPLKDALQKYIDNATVEDFRKLLQTCVSASGGHFEHNMMIT